MDPKFKDIIKLFATLPGIGPRQATRITLALLDKPQEDLTELGQAIVQLKERVHRCRECFNVSDDGVCTICRDTHRDVRTIMAVEKVTDLESVERSGLYHGLYHVLGGAIDPVQGVPAGQLRIRELAERTERFVREAGTVEIIVATNPTSAGEMTAMYLADMFKPLPGVRVTRLARGLASGTHLEYADEITLRHALESRK
jgi:recombination protein RecR